MAEQEECVRIEHPVPKEEERVVIQLDITELRKTMRRAAKIFVAIVMNIGFTAATYLFMKYVLHI